MSQQEQNKEPLGVRLRRASILGIETIKTEAWNEVEKQLETLGAKVAPEGTIYCFIDAAPRDRVDPGGGGSKTSCRSAVTDGVERGRSSTFHCIMAECRMIFSESQSSNVENESCFIFLHLRCRKIKKSMYTFQVSSYDEVNVPL